MVHSLSSRQTLLILLAILAVAAVLRLYGQNWDQGIYLHPDERFIAFVSSDRVSLPPISDLDTIFVPAASPLNPRRDNAEGTAESFAYGTLPIYVQGAVSWLLDSVWDRGWGEYGQLYRVGRSLSALLDVLTVLFVFLIGRRLAGDVAGLLGATLYAFAVLAIQLSHFFTVDVWLTLFVTATLYFSIRFVDQPTFSKAAAVGIPLGMAFATKASVPSLLIPLAAAFIYAFWQSDQRWRIAGYALAGSIVSLVVFSLFEPYALIRHEPFIKDIKTQSRIVRGIFDVPFTRQFVGLTPGIYELKNLARFSIGPAFLIAGIGGVAFASRRFWKQRDPAVLILLLWVVSYVPVLLYTEAKFLRYALPLLPVLAALIGLLLASLLLDPRWKRLGQAVTAVCLGVTAIWGLGFVSIYGETNPRIDASNWIYENIPPGAIVTAEAWDDPLPLRIGDLSGNRYQTVTMDIYGDLPPEEKVDYLYETLSDVDYVILSSDRIAGSVDNLPLRYAVQNEYYRRLTDGQLGFQLVYEGELNPELFGYEYDVLDADESFWVYDQPRVRIYERVEALSREEFRERFLWSINQPWEPTRYPARETLLLDSPVGEIETNAEAGFNPLGRSNDLAAIFSWLVVIELIGLSILPLASFLFRRAPDRGALSTRLVGLVTVAWIVWIGASLDLWRATTLTTLVVVLIIGGACWGWFYYSRSFNRNLMLPSLHTYLLGALLYLVVFGLFLSFRLYYPDFWQPFLGGEKPFELAYLRAVSASTSFPPYDPWYADGVINYYYYGWHLVATVTRLSGVGVSNGFQLAAATLPALFAIQLVALTGLVYLGRTGIRRVVKVAGAGMLVLVMVLVIGNLDAVRQLWEMRGEVDARFDFWGSTRVIDFTINEFPWFTAIWADVHPHMMNLPVIALFLTLIVSVVVDVKRQAARHLFEYRTLVVPLAVTALVLGTLSVTNSWDMPLNVLVTLAALIYAGLLIGARTGAVFAGIGLLTVGLSVALFAPFHLGFYTVAEGVDIAENGSSLSQFVTVWGIFIAVVSSVILAEGVRRWRQGWDLADGWLFATVVLATGGIIAIIGGSRTAGFSSASFILALMFAALIITAAAIIARPLQLHPLLLVLVTGMSMLAAGFSSSRPAASVALAVTAASGMIALQRWRFPSQFLPWAFVAIASVTLAATEIVYVVDDLQNGAWQRMNTVFKFSLQAWILFGIGAALLLARLWWSCATPPFPPGRPDRLGAVATPEPHLTPVERSRTGVSNAAMISTVFALLATAFVIAGLAYPIVGTPVRLRQNMSTTPGQLTLDGYSWMENGSITNGTGDVIDFTGDLAAINWLNDNVDHAAVLVEAAIGPYRGNGGRISSGTGLPAVMGWDRHQRQQRYPEGIDARMRDVREIYSSTDPRRKMELLRSYGVEYVIVGDVERFWNTPEDPQVYASSDGLATFDTLVADGSLELVFEEGNTRIYRLPDFPSLPQLSASGARP